MTNLAGDIRSGVSSQRGLEDSEDVGRRYRFKRLALPIVLRDMHYSKGDPGPGDRMPDFDRPTLDGVRFRSSDLEETGPVLLIFGSYTCPVTDSAAPGLNELYARFGDRVRFVMVDVREAHPGKAVPQPETLNEKMAHAEQLRDVHGFEFEVAVDDIDGNLHRALSPKPNSAYVLGKDGTILFRAKWANDTKALAAALEAIAAGKSPSRSQSGGVVRPILRQMGYMAPVLDRAGGGAWRDMWRVAPPMGATAFALKTLRIRPPKPDHRESWACSLRAERPPASPCAWMAGASLVFIPVSVRSHRRITLPYTAPL